ncbi:MAG: phage tail protein [Calditrichaeota bacterium]|nr:MAG: phage tail protein [Calditrichota bacterium]
MPEYLAPGVYVEETSFRSKSIEGVSTSTAGFVGPARFGPIKGEPELLTSFADFERIYGGMDQLTYDQKSVHNYLAHAVRAFFEEGGKRLYVARIYSKASDSEGNAHATTGDGISGVDLEIKARYPGAAGNVPVAFSFKFGQNILTSVPKDPSNVSDTDLSGTDLSDRLNVLRGVRDGDVVWMGQINQHQPEGGDIYRLEQYFDNSEKRNSYRLISATYDDVSGVTRTLSSLQPSAQVRKITMTLTMDHLGKFMQPRSWDNLTFHPDHPRALTTVFAETPQYRATELYNPLIITTAATDGASIALELLNQTSATGLSGSILDTLDDYFSGEEKTSPSDAALSFSILLSQGSDGVRPDATAYQGADGGSSTDKGSKSGLRSFEDIEDISIIAAPGSTAEYSNVNVKPVADTVTRLLISHCERMRYRVAVLDSADNHLVSQVRSYRGQLDSTHAALYYPWVRILDPVTNQEINLPPSGFISGIYARNDVETGVHKAPANEVVRLAINFEQLLNKGQQDVLNPEGINCFRFFPGRGYLLWGARTISSDPEWKYVSSRRYFAYLERSIDKGTQWAVFEPNGDALWGNVRQTISDFLFNEWKSGRLLGLRPEDAYFVRCDRSTMDQNDLDNGRLVCLIGVAILKPAEFVIFRIGQWTGDTRR